MKNYPFKILQNLTLILTLFLVSCGGSGGGGGSSAVAISATANTTAQSLTVGTAMTSFSPLTPSGGVTPYTFSYTGTLPTGLSFDAGTGAVTGTPTVVYAAADLVFSVRDANNVVASTTSTVIFTVVAAVVTSKLNDTGITASQCYELGSDAMAACNTAMASLLFIQDGQTGRDANLATNSNTDGKLGFSFTSVTGGCVLDNVTGLMWEVKTADAVPGLRDWNETYTNYTPTFNPGGQYGYGTATDATGFVNAVNANTLCGFNDWRLPTVDELQGLVDYGAPGSAIDTTWFPNTQQSTPSYWSASPDVGALSNGVPSSAWSVSFGNGSVLSEQDSRPHPVRLVRGAATAKTYVYSAGGEEVTDQETGLTWRRCAEGMVFISPVCTGTASKFTHEAALQLWGTWRLPNIKELSSIADKRLNPAADPAVFPDYLTGGFWSSTPYVSAPGNAEIVNFIDGSVTYLSRSGTAYVRLVHVQ